MEQAKDIKPRPDRAIYIRALRGMTPEARLLKACELSRFAKELFLHGMRKRFPGIPEAEFRRLVLRQLEKCWKRSY